MYCSLCGRPNEQEANFCKHCGAELTAPSGAAPKQAAAPPQPKKGCCSCFGCFFTTSIIFAVLFAALVYVIYSGPESVNRFFAAGAGHKKEMASLEVSDESGKQLEKRVSKFSGDIQKGGTAEIALKETELNSFIAKNLPLLKDPKGQVEFREAKLKVIPEGVRLMGVVKILKFESFFMLSAKAAVNGQRQIEYTVWESQLGKIKFPAALLSSMIGRIKKMAKLPEGSTNQLTIGGATFNVNKIEYGNGVITIECANAAAPKK